MRDSICVRRFSPNEPLEAGRRLSVWLERITDSRTCTDFLFGGFNRSGRLISAALLVPQDGRTGLLFTPPTSRKIIPALTDVLETLCTQVTSERIKLAQALLLSTERNEKCALHDAGFQRMAELSYMQCRLMRGMSVPPLPAGVQILNYREELETLFRATLEETYIGSLDCPMMRSMRDPKDVLTGHRAVGRFQPELWSLVRVSGRPAALLLLNRVPAASCVELVYLGVTPDHRGAGLAGHLLRHALAKLSQSGESHITLAVDNDNDPALALYRSVGFVRHDSREVFVRKVI
jgi:GNAT superfamily N-acetyltransferase